MTFFGLHPADALIVLLYIIAVLAVGHQLARKVKNENDFFLGGRKMGKWFQFFLNFGNMTDPSQAATTASSVYRQGVSGVWLGLIPLLMSPFYWFIPIWYRRVRVTTTADLFDDRFGNRFLSSFYAIIVILIGVITIGLGNIIAFKTLAPIMVKPAAAYTVAERQQLRDYSEFVQLREIRLVKELKPEQQSHYDVLKGLFDRGRLPPYISYLSPASFYFAASALAAVFIMLGGLEAAAVVNGLQSVLTILISVVLIPFGLARIGGFHGLHAKVPNWMFQIFGTNGSAGQYTWFSISAFLLVSLIGTAGATNTMSISGSAKSEFAARLGAISGGLTKRFVTISWGVCGLIAVALFGPNLSDPDQTWGRLTGVLLPVGMIGLMIVGILGGKLAALGSASIVNSALVVRNIYEPLFPGKSQRHYMVVARLTIPLVLLLGIGIALYMESAVALLIFMIVILVVWGAPILLIFTWRRLTETAVRIQMISTLLFIAIIPWIVMATPALRQAPSLTVMTKGNLAGHIDPVSVFFEGGVARINPTDLNSPKEGIGRFNDEIYLLSRLGMDMTEFSPAGLSTARYLVDSILPLLMLIGLSYVTRQTDPVRVARFYVRMKTPVSPDPAEDALAVQASYAEPSRFDHTKLFPGTDCELTKWDKMDILGFLGCCASIGVILLFFKAVLMIGG
jgi:solute:Na+ symporter, SSS family